MYQVNPSLPTVQDPLCFIFHPNPLTSVTGLKLGFVWRHMVYAYTSPYVYPLEEAVLWKLFVVLVIYLIFLCVSAVDSLIVNKFGSCTPYLRTVGQVKVSVGLVCSAVV